MSRNLGVLSICFRINKIVILGYSFYWTNFNKFRSFFIKRNAYLKPLNAVTSSVVYNPVMWDKHIQISVAAAGRNITIELICKSGTFIWLSRYILRHFPGLYAMIQLHNNTFIFLLSILKVRLQNFRKNVRDFWHFVFANSQHSFGYWMRYYIHIIFSFTSRDELWK
jgi:hypothetical protein